jgi:endonuclease/exonuclease/phosphatase family metal-dependent hydrolase
MSPQPPHRGSRRHSSRVRTLIAWLVVLPWAVWAAVRVLGLERGFPFVQLMAFTPYVVLLALVAGVLAALLRRRAPAAVAAATVVVLATLLAPRAIGADSDARGRELRIMTANAFYGRLHADELAALVRRERVDVLTVQELSPQLAQWLENLMPHKVTLPKPRGGSGIYSMRPLRPLQPFEGASSDMAAAELEGGVKIISVHVAVPLRGDDLPRWRADLRNLPAAAPDGPVQLLAGDFNSTLDHDALRELVGRGYRDAAEVTGAGFRPTWQGRRAPPVTIDHILVPERVGVRDVAVHELPRSDHDSVVATVVLPQG